MDGSQKWTQVHLPVKLLKLLVQDLQRTTDNKVNMKEIWDLWYGRCCQDCDVLYEGEGIEGTLEQLLTSASYGGEEWQVPVDSDLLGDPIMEVDVKVRMIQVTSDTLPLH